MLDILLVNPPSPDGSIIIRDINRSGRSSREGMIWPQTGLAYLAAMLKDTYKVGIIDCIAEDWDWPKFRTFLHQENPRYILTNVITATLTNDMSVVSLAKELKAVTIAIGPHVTDLPKETLQFFPELDYIIRGEAELTVGELIDACERKSGVGEVRGIAFRDGSGIVITEEREFIDDLNILPMPAHELLPLKKYYRPFFGNYTFIITSRGCPFNCSFCRQTVMWKGKFRQRSVKSIIEEIKYLQKLGLDSLLLHADTFTVNKDWVIQLCKEIIDSNISIRWACNTHAATIDREMVKWMKKSGCWMIAPGIENASQVVLDNVNKGATVSQIREAVEIIHSEGIEVWGYFVLGLPGETKESIKETIKLSKDLPLDMANFAVGSPYPGTKFFNQAKEQGWISNRSEEHTSELQSHSFISYAVFCLKKKNNLYPMRSFCFSGIHSIHH